jgi:hypothetical protein
MAFNASISLVPERILRGTNLINPLKTQRHASLSLKLALESPASKCMLLCCHISYSSR